MRFDGAGAANQEGLYWRYEMAVRELESRLGGVTAGNGAINAVRRDAYLFLEPTRGQDISFPFELAKRGWRSVYAPEAVARERLAATIGGEFARKRRMMAGAWGTMLRHGLLSPRGYGPLYAFEIALAPAAALRCRRSCTWSPSAPTSRCSARGTVYVVTLAAQLALLAAAALGARRAAARRSGSPTTTSRSPPRAPPACGTTCATACPRTWEKAEGTR